MDNEPLHAPRQQDALARLLPGPAFGRVPPIGDRRRLLERLLVDLLVGRDFQLLGKGAIRFGDHAFTRDDRVAFDAGTFARHSGLVHTPIAPMMAPCITSTPSQWMPSITVSEALRCPKALLTAMVVMTKPSHMNSPLTIPFFSVPCPGPRWPMPPARIQAMMARATIETMKGMSDPLPLAESSCLVVPTAASHGRDSDM